LSRQWDRVLDYNFESITLVINDAVYTLQPERNTARPDGRNQRGEK